jgi:hypothetical protein
MMAMKNDMEEYIVIAELLAKTNNNENEHLYKYQQFIKDNYSKIRKTYPFLSNKETYLFLAEEWNNSK